VSTKKAENYRLPPHVVRLKCTAAHSWLNPGKEAPVYPVSGRLLPKCNALQYLLRQYLLRHIDRMRCLNAKFYALFSERRRSWNARKKKQRNAAEV